MENQKVERMNDEMEPGFIYSFRGLYVGYTRGPEN